MDCGGSTCAACPTNCGTTCYYYDGTCSASYIDACDGCDMGCEVHDPDCDDPSSTCLDPCPCLNGNSSWYCDGFDDCSDPSCECAGDNPCVADCFNGIQDCDETAVECGGATCGACPTCGSPCYYYDGTCSSSYIDACDGCDMGCEVHDPDCDDPSSTCMDPCPCLAGLSNWYCDGWDDCADPSCECAGE